MEKSNDLFRGQAIRNYNTHHKDESFYWLGRVAHLFEDAAQPSHVHLDAHTGQIGDGTSILEDYTGNNFKTLKNTLNWQSKNINHT